MPRKSSALKKYSRHGGEVTLTPGNMDEYQPRTYSADRVRAQSILIDVIRRASGKEVGMADAMEFGKQKE